jgi:hypothetical protein
MVLEKKIKINLDPNLKIHNQVIQKIKKMEENYLKVLQNHLIEIHPQMDLQKVKTQIIKKVVANI